MIGPQNLVEAALFTSVFTGVMQSEAQGCRSIDDIQYNGTSSHVILRHSIILYTHLSLPGFLRCITLLCLWLAKLLKLKSTEGSKNTSWRMFTGHA